MALGNRSNQQQIQRIKKMKANERSKKKMPRQKPPRSLLAESKKESEAERKKREEKE